MTMLIKVCGMREPDNIREVSKLDIDMMGFIFYPKSPRFVRMISSVAGIIPDYSEERLNKARKREVEPVVNHKLKRVGVFVDDMPQNIVTRIFNYNLDYVQLHGDEPRATCENLRRTVDPDIHPGIKIIKTIKVAEPQDIERYKEYVGAVDMLLFDTKCPSYGGSGNKFSWDILQYYDGELPFLLGGGIGPDDVEAVKNFKHPRFAGIDLNSKFETEPAVKDVEKLRTFIEKLRNE